MCQKFLEDVKFIGKRYEVCLSWKEDHSTLPDNFYLSKCRLKSLLHRGGFRQVQKVRINLSNNSDF